LNNDFFECIEGSEIRKGKVSVALSVVRVLDAFELDFRMNGIVTVACDRCLDDVEIPVETTNRLIVTLGESYAETSDEQVIISEEEGFIDVAWYLYEFIALAIPIKHVHQPGDCNEVMASKLRELCVDELKEADEVSESENSCRAIDPRWETLRDLIEDN
jgi:uncharacterized metal-binding protein YceD (DUF177 family)